MSDTRYTVTALSAIRKVIAARMSEAARTIPHFRITAEIEMDAIFALRSRLRECDGGMSVSLNDLLIKACAAALMDVPAVNIQWLDDGTIRQMHSADIAIMVALEGGGIATPIVHDASSKTIWEIAREVEALSARAARNALRMDEVFGGSFSISNLGMYGVDQFDAIVNAPQCAILAIAGAKPRCVVSTDREVRVATVLRATLSVDHRALDGTAAAAFMAAFRRRVEEPAHLMPTAGR